MKKLLLLLTCAFALTAGMNAQDAISTFEMSYFSESGLTEYETSAAEPDVDGKFAYYIDMYSFEGERRAISLMVESKHEAKFINLLENLKSTYVKWDSTAVANSVTDLNKDMNIDKLRLKAAFSYGDWQFDYSVNLKASFKQIEGVSVLIIRTGELQSTSNQFMKTDGGAFIFNSAEEIDAFINTINSSSVSTHFDEKNSKKDLFED